MLSAFWGNMQYVCIGNSFKLSSVYDLMTYETKI